MKIQKAIIILSLFFSGCAPTAGSFLRPAIEGAEYRGTRCGAPYYIAYFPLKDIFISLSLGSVVKFVLHIPKNQTAQLLERSVEIRTKSPEGERMAVVDFDPPKWINVSGGNDLSLLSGSTREHVQWFGKNLIRHEEYIFYARYRFEGVESGIIKLPNMLINNKEVAGLTIPFARTDYFSITPLNGC